MKNDGNLLNRYLELAFNQAKELVYIKDSNMRFLVCNGPFADFFGMDSPEKAEGLRADDIMAPLTASKRINLQNGKPLSSQSMLVQLKLIT